MRSLQTKLSRPSQLNETDLHVVLCYDSQKVDVVVGVEPGHVLAADGFRPKHLHLPVQAVVHHQIVGHANPVWLHGVPLTVVIVPDLGCKRRKRGGIVGGTMFYFRLPYSSSRKTRGPLHAF